MGIGDFMIALGGESYSSYLKSAEIFDAETQSWTSLPPLLHFRTWGLVSYLVNRSRVFACGGFETFQNEGIMSASCETLNLSNQQAGWKMMAPMIYPHVSAAGVLLPDNNTFIVTGGSSVSLMHNLCEKYDITKGKWSQIANLTTIRAYHCAVFYRNRVVVLGGYAIINFSPSCEQYDTATNKWSPFTSMKIGRSDFGATVVMDKIYVAGGWTDGDGVLSSVEFFDGTSWSLLLNTPNTIQRVRCAAVSFQNKLVILGGYNSPLSEAAPVLMYDPLNRVWSTLPDMIEPFRAYVSALSNTPNEWMTQKTSIDIVYSYYHEYRSTVPSPLISYNSTIFLIAINLVMLPNRIGAI
jgi:hypothetical protein